MTDLPKRMPLSPATVVARHPDMLFEQVSEEVVMLSIATGKYFGLDPVGAEIWQLLSEPRSIGDLSAALIDTFDVDADTCLRDVTEFLTTLISDGSVVVSPAS